MTDHDETQLQLVIHDVPQAEVWALSLVLADWGLEVDWDGPPAERGTVHVGEVYTYRDTSGDASERLADRIIDEAPGATFQTWTDQCPAYLGSLVRYTPELGDHRADCNDSGDALFDERQILTAGCGSFEDLRRLVGADWTNALTGRTVERTLTATDPADDETTEG